MEIFTKMCCYDIIITLEHVGVCQNTFTGAYEHKTWKNHDFCSEVENSGVDFRSMTKKVSDLISELSEYFCLGSFPEQRYRSLVMWKNAKTIKKVHFASKLWVQKKKLLFLRGGWLPPNRDARHLWFIVRRVSEKVLKFCGFLNIFVTAEENLLQITI